MKLIINLQPETRNFLMWILDRPVSFNDLLYSAIGIPHSAICQ